MSIKVCLSIPAAEGAFGLGLGQGKASTNFFQAAPWRGRVHSRALVHTLLFPKALLDIWFGS